MNVDPLITSLPSKSDKERRLIRARAEDWVADGSSAQQEAGRKVLDAFAKLKEREAASDPASKIENAFTRMPPSDLEGSLLQVLLDHPGATSTTLTQAMGWQDKAWQLHFGKIGWDRQDYLWPAPWNDSRNEPFKAGILADFDEATSGFTMKPEVIEGLERVGVKGRQK